MTGEMRNAAAVGMFDGVHRGHLDILATVDRQARSLGGHPVILSFAQHPVSLLRPAEAPRLLTLAAEKEALIHRFLPGAEVHMLDFGAMRRESARDFLAGLRDRLGVGVMVMGYDNRFGCDGPRDRGAYDELGRELGVGVVHVPPLVAGCDTVSSTAVRRLVCAGDVRSAASLLGREYSLAGTVVAGRRLGRRLGFPTANVEADPMKLLPARGVYACRASVRGSVYPAMVNIGVRPTVEDDAAAQISVEAHLIGMSGDIYGERLTLLFADRLRDECRFGSLDELTSHLAADRDATLRLLKQDA